MSFDLFQRSPFENDTALLQERWAQDGSTHVQNRSDITSTTGNTAMYSVPSGKIFYMTDLILIYQALTGANNKARLLDGAPGNIIDLTPDGWGVSQPIHFQFKVPLKFSTQVQYSPSVSGSHNITGYATVIGWLEDA